MGRFDGLSLAYRPNSVRQINSRGHRSGQDTLFNAARTLFLQVAITPPLS
jgi:hypothetical protein